ncbi:hypothetical protein PHYBLDRAFT_73457 [Phycomyces blakesleeanus NRRL 1555(-)]|uniref:Helitron helicase-like domain-containing protein n=1 Tax=Phycomyces blakesleeanus (strain ATCC 8743b / DSM 1359 / FGSC 10004 / NBRC 33097 / NRRL 1555) TaxID=763407 RepID=A0A167RG30_PHYB8|nr:hypothetical protein PHYBLDRAFT_73457 [Phycomyces blakesleeanus NRRL 1555(-)]OAD81565.1 hypothetical protein PHYBLDRAFT_73457 [Phycomyces blakesleeanus NRRL 1555(-)]|eukprot:XP_018299605.1 hypothetical protein PHYBLDRAFT_73457 [Phycomyces blakesleeanus NRRL 1555(-)]
MTPVGPVCASCKQLGHSRRSNLSFPLNPRNKTLLISQKRTSDNLSTQEEYQTESSRAGALRPKVETVQNHVVLTIAEIIALFRADQYSAENLTAAFERVLNLTTTTAITTVTVIPHCSSCNAIGHLWSNSLQCPYNRWHHTFVPGQLAVTHNMAWRTTTSLPPTDNRGAMNIHEKNYTFKANNIKFSMCCRLGTVILPPFEPTPPGIAELLENIDQSVANNIGGVYNFQIHGTICHKIGSVFPTTQTQMDQPKFAQVYIFDPASQVDHRHCNAPELDREVAVLMSDTEHNEARDIILHTQTNYLHKINEYHRNYDALQYVLLFSSGDFGWTVDRYTPTGSKISTMDCRLEYYVLNQKKMRAELYSDIQNAVHLNDNDMANLGQRVILPSSFLGSPQCMHEFYQDAMDIVRHFGKPDLFVTFTCNPTWPEITNSLLGGQSASDHCKRRANSVY